MSQEFTGWLATSSVAEVEQLRFAVDGQPVAVTYYQREDVEQKLQDLRCVGWTFYLDHKTTFAQSRRTLELTISLGDQWLRSWHFCRSKDLMPVGKGGPLFFMHIPKTAGTALRQFVDYAFDGFSSMLLYGHFPGISQGDFTDAHLEFARTRELIFGHYDFDFVRAVSEVNPKVVTVFREPQALLRSYLRFNENPAPEFLDNPLVRHVCGLSYTEPFGLITAQHLELALHLVERHFHVLQQDRLQEFADDVTDAFGMPRFQIPLINHNPPADVQTQIDLPIDLRFDQQLYAACRQDSRSFLEFLNT